MILTQPLYLRMIIFATISLFLLFTFSCKKDPISSIPISAVATSTIGSDGGTLETAEFSLQVPAGSFQNETILSLYISSDVSTFGENSVSQSFMVDGIPEVIEKPISIAIKYNGELSDSTYISHSILAEDIIGEDTTYVSYFISVVDSSGFIVGKLNPISEDYLSRNRNISTNSIPNVFEAITKYKVFETTHFRIDYSAIYSEETMQQFGNLLENTFNTIETDLGFSFNNNAPFPDDGFFTPSCLQNDGEWQYYCWDWPIDIEIKEVKSKIVLGWPKKHPFGSDRIGPFINADGTMMGSSIGSQAEFLIGKILLEIAQLTNRNYFHEYWWFGRTIQYWLEEYFGLISKKQPPSIWKNNELAPFQGLHKPIPVELDFFKHDEGMVSFVKYLVDNNKIDDKGLGYIFRFMEENNVHIVNSLLNNVNALVADWWPDFFEKLISGDIYNINSSVFMNSTNLAGTWDINSESDTEKVFNNNYPDLSAKRFIINLNHSTIDTSANLVLDASGGVSSDGIATLVFEVNSSNNLQHLVTAKGGPVEIPNLKNYYDNGIRKFLVVVVNSIHNGTDYLGSTDIDLNVSVKQQEPTSNYNNCTVWYKVKHNLSKVITKSNGDQTVDNYSEYNENYEPYLDGSFDGNIFTGSYTIDENDRKAQGTVNVELNLNNDTVKSFSLSNSSESENGNYTYTTTWNINGANLIKTQDNFGLLIFRAEGSSVCNYITSSDYTKFTNYYVSDSNWKTYDVTTVSYECDTDCFIEIKFKNK